MYLVIRRDRNGEAAKGRQESHIVYAIDKWMTCMALTRSALPAIFR